MNNFLANKKLFFGFGFFLIFIIISFLLFSNRNKTYLYKPVNKDNIKTEQIIIQKIAEKDSDKDGLRDWEEKLWKTDPHNPDTDGDGTNDGEEVKEGRDPLKPGPNDYIKNNIKSSVNNNNKKLTETDKISRELLAGYLDLKQSNSFNKENEKKLVNTIIDNSLSNNDEIKIYLTKNINVSNKNDLNSLTDYSNKVIKILKQNSNFENNLVVLKTALETKNKEELNKINDSLVNYKKIQEGLLKMSVPSKFISIHLEIINIVGSLINNTEKMTKVFDDPIPVLVAVRNYIKNEKKIVEDFKNLWNSLRESGVILNI